MANSSFRVRLTWIYAGLLIAALNATPAFAHAHLQSSIPDKDATVSTPLTEIVVTFNEPVTPAVMNVLDQDGQPVKTVGQPRAEGNSLHLPLTARLAPGHYTATWRVAGSDTHVVTGSLAFVVAKTAP